ncbi:MAG: hypothetical protein ACI90V_001432 [Bacillariaceae sp.]|jgi:hypothetical protein
MSYVIAVAALLLTDCCFVAGFIACDPNLFWRALIFAWRIFNSFKVGSKQHKAKKRDSERHTALDQVKPQYCTNIIYLISPNTPTAALSLMH